MRMSGPGPLLALLAALISGWDSSPCPNTGLFIRRDRPESPVSVCCRRCARWRMHTHTTAMTTSSRAPPRDPPRIRYLSRLPPWCLVPLVWLWEVPLKG